MTAQEGATKYLERRDVVPSSMEAERIRFVADEVYGATDKLFSELFMLPEWTTNTPEQKFLTLYYHVMQSTLAHHIQQETATLESIATVFGGEHGNPYIIADTYGTFAVQSILEVLGEDGPRLRAYFNEELGMVDFEPDPEGFNLALDPLDESSKLLNGDRMLQSSALLLTDTDGNVRAGLWMDLSHDQYVYFDGQEVHTQIKQDMTADSRPVRVAMLHKRLDKGFSQSAIGKVLTAEGAEFLDTFGGGGNFLIASGAIDAMIDPIKGQPAKEAVQWIAMARFMGLEVILMDQNDEQTLIECMKDASKLDSDLRIRLMIMRPQSTTFLPLTVH